MSDAEQKADHTTTEKYIAQMAIISGMETRLRWSELAYLSLNVVVFLFTINLFSSLTHTGNYVLTYIDLALIFFCIFIGLSINTYWVAFAMRLQLKLKLRYFQMRFLERKMNSTGEHMYSDESIFFDPDIRHLKSPDNKETLYYPTSGLSRMDGFVGATKPRHFSWIIPCLFSILYWILFILVLTSI